MDIEEYKKIKDMSYYQYCDYLQQKYGIGLCDYMTKSWNKNNKISRTKEGLVVHHKFEDQAKLLSHPEYAKQYPFEWQQAKNMIYCNYLEHLFLHILICEKEIFDEKITNLSDIKGLGGIIQYIVPELNDLYSGWETKETWRKNCHNLISQNIDIYLILLKRIKNFCKSLPAFNIQLLCTSFNEPYGVWSNKLNQELYTTIKNL